MLDTRGTTLDELTPAGSAKALAPPFPKSEKAHGSSRSSHENWSAKNITPATRPVSSFEVRQGPDKHGLDPPAYVRFAEGTVDIHFKLLQDPKYRGPNFDPVKFPIGRLIFLDLRGDEVIDASAEELDDARHIAQERWAHLWGLKVEDLEPEE